MRATIFFEIGVNWKLTNEASEGFRRLARLYKQKNRSLYIMSANDGDHQMDSFHYINRAFDFRKNGVNKGDIKTALGGKWDVIEYSWGGYHCEFDPK